MGAPSTGDPCFIDLAHNSAALNFSGLVANDKPEVYGPFVRVTSHIRLFRRDAMT